MTIRLKGGGTILPRPKITFLTGFVNSYMSVYIADWLKEVDIHNKKNSNIGYNTGREKYDN